MSKQEIIQKTLRFFAKKILRKYKPRIIGITGSVGKSTTKEMIFTVLEKKFHTRKSEKNYNNEVGIPLTIIGVTGEKKNILQWVGVFIQAIRVSFFSNNYPDVLVLELAADQIGDIKYFCDFIPIEVGVLTNVGISHLENFKTKENIFKEKSYLLKQANKFVIYNKDNIDVEKIQKIITVDNKSYGLNNQADFNITEVGYNYNKQNVLKGTIFKVIHGGKSISGKLNNLMGRPYLYGVLAAVTVADYFDIDLKEAIASLENRTVMPGHMALIKGIKNTSIIDDTYNSAPASVKEALGVTSEIEASRKIIVLGDMLELGKREASSHKLVGKKVADIKNSIFVAVGDKMKIAVDRFKKKVSNNQSRVYWFENSIEAGRFVQNLIKTGDLILVKGSQGMRMEKIVLEIMAEPNRKKELIVRQDKDWIE